MPLTSVVVGVDGSMGSDRALVWALEEGRIRDLPVRAINVWQPSGAPLEVERLAALHSVADLRAGLLRDVTSSVDAVVAREGAANVATTSHVIYGHPIRELTRAAGSDSLLVVGSRGRGSATGSLFGSVSQGCVQYATGTVIVVPRPEPRPEAGRVVVGVDGSPLSVRALRFADDEARRRHASLQVVHAWSPPYLGFAGGPGGLQQEAVDEIAVQAAETLQDSMRRGAVDPMRTDVEIRLVEGSPAPALLAAADDADLVVVGSRGYGGWKGLLMGSVSTQCVAGSPCPVAVIRSHADEDDK
ncbi:universal stress protein [Micromonospora matsumotoense]|uniref:universal stress protein n=1 Tax=Micromonospora matsumotoense TaxID=121616 RepID=UPI003D90A985